MIIGILALQGSFAKHAQCLEASRVTPKLIRYAGDFEGTQGLIIPGGESTTMTRILSKNDLVTPLSEYPCPVFGTCAGAILLANSIDDQRVHAFGKIPMEIHRNAYGRQVESFIENVQLEFNDKPFRGVFIRAPRITKLSRDADPLGSLNNETVLVRYNRYLASTFHPELTGDHRIHEYFIAMCRDYQQV